MYILYSESMKKTHSTVSTRRFVRSIDASVKMISRKFSRLNEAQRLRAMQIIANSDDVRAFDSIVRNSFVSNTEV